MNDNEFWKLIEQSSKNVLDSETNFEVNLSKKLATEHYQSLIRFQYILESKIEQINIESVLAACHLVMGECSDDTFLEFRGWIISNGKKEYLRILSNPDSIISLLDSRDDSFYGIDFDLFAATVAEEIHNVDYDVFADEVEEYTNRYPYEIMPSPRINDSYDFIGILPRLSQFSSSVRR